MEVLKSKTSLVNKYYEQPDRLPKDLKELIFKSWEKQNILLYSFADLDSHFQLAEQWIVVGQLQIVFATRRNSKWEIKILNISEISATKELSGLSYRKLLFENQKAEVIFSVNYTLRQATTMSSVKFVLEQMVDQKKYELDFENDDADSLYLKQLVKPIEKAQASISGGQYDVVWRLLALLRPYKYSVLLGMSGAVLMTLVSLVPAFLTGKIIDEVIKPFQAGQLTKDIAIKLTYITLMGLITVYILREFFAWIRLQKMAILGEYVARDLRDRVYNHLQKLSLSFFNSKQTGSIISRVGADTDRIWDFIAFGVVEVTTSIIMLMGLSVVLVALDWRLGLLVSLPVPFILFIIYWHGQSMQKLFLKAWRKWSDLTDCLSDTIPGIKVVKSFNKEKEEVQRFRLRNQSVVKEFNGIHKAWTRFWPFLMLTIQAIVIGVWTFGMPRVLDHIEYFNKTGNIESGLSPGVFISFVLYLGMFVQPIEIIGQMSRMINRATSSAHRVFEILDTEPQILNLKGALPLEDFKGEVEFKNVNFSYDGVRKTLKSVSFKINSGEMVGLVGPSGSGKTTITNLIARFYDAQSGEILIDGKKITSIDLNSYRSQMGIVLQDPYLFHGTILDNIKYAHPEATLKEIISAAKAANAHDFICNLPQAYDTVVGERGHTLSGGERQRISIARAILRNPKILILDEATSSVDTETEKKIQQALDRLVKGRTTIAIAHRLSTLAQANKILVLKNGELKEQGTSIDLMKLENGVYKNLVNMQRELHANKV